MNEIILNEKTADILSDINNAPNLQEDDINRDSGFEGEDPILPPPTETSERAILHATPVETDDESIETPLRDLFFPGDDEEDSMPDPARENSEAQQPYKLLANIIDSINNENEYNNPFDSEEDDDDDDDDYDDEDDDFIDEEEFNRATLHAATLKRTRDALTLFNSKCSDEGQESSFQDDDELENGLEDENSLEGIPSDDSKTDPAGHPEGGSEDHPSGDNDILEKYRKQIYDCLLIGNKGLIRAGGYMNLAKESIGISLDTEDEPQNFVEWRASFGLSEYQSRRIMRVTRHFMDKIDWDADDDPVLNELAKVGQCRLDELQKLPKEMYFFNDKNELVVLDDEAEILVKSQKVATLNEIYKKWKFPPSSEDGTSPQENKENNGSEDDNKEDNNIGDNNDGNHDNDSEQQKEEGNEPDPANEKIIPQGKEPLTSTPWSYGDRESIILTITNGVTGSKDSDNSQIISAVNTYFKEKEGTIEPDVEKPEVDAFYTIIKKGVVTIFWYDHVEDTWHKSDTTSVVK